MAGTSIDMSKVKQLLQLKQSACQNLTLTCRHWFKGVHFIPL